MSLNHPTRVAEHFLIHGAIPFGTTWKVSQERHFTVLEGILSVEEPVHPKPRPYVFVFPRQEHLEAFRQAQKPLMREGPSDFAPGSVGSLKMQEFPHLVSVYGVQAHYKVGGKNPLPEPLRKTYAGWRKVALRRAIESAHALGKEIVFLPVALRNRQGLQEDLARVCKELKIPIVDHYGWHVRPPGWKPPIEEP